MITDAMHTPTTIAPKAFFQSMPRRDATRAPVQAPVPGSGIPTKSTSPQNSYLLIRSLLLIAFSPAFLQADGKGASCCNHAKIGRIRSRINGIGIRFPTRQIGIARQVGIFKNAGPAARIPPLSSRIGIIEIIKIISSLAPCHPDELQTTVLKFQSYKSPIFYLLNRCLTCQ